MSNVLLSPKAQTLLQEFVIHRGADDYLLDRLTEQLELIAASPATMTEVAGFPYPPDRLMANFILNDSKAQRWGFTVTLRRTPDESGIYVLTINAAHYPDNLDS